MEAIVSDVPFRSSRYFRHLVEQVGALTNVLQMIEYQEEKYVPQASGDQQTQHERTPSCPFSYPLLNREDTVGLEAVGGGL